MSPYEAYCKCLEQKIRILELEEMIATDSECSYWYALNVIKGPFEGGEEVISKNPKHSLWYAIKVINEPFEKCHPVIFNSKYKNSYIDFLRLINYKMINIEEWLI